jgi:mannose-6-phosphate isomerase-like protein (cupin superfamily)
MDAIDILREMAEAYAQKARSPEGVTVSFAIDGDATICHLSAQPEQAVCVEAGEHPKSEFTVVTTTEILRKLAHGEMSPLTAAGRENLRQPAPLDFRLPEGVSFTIALYHRITLFVQRFFNPLPGERIRIDERASRIVHGGHVVALYADVGFRSAWYLLNPGEQVNEPGDANPFPQAFVVLSGSGTAHIGGVSHDLQPHTAYYIPPGAEHVARPSPDGPLTVIWFAWGEGA